MYRNGDWTPKKRENGGWKEARQILDQQDLGQLYYSGSLLVQ